MKRRRFFHYAGLGSVGLVVAANERSLAAIAGTADSQALSLGVPLNSFEFTATTVDRTGRVKRQQSLSAQFFPEPLPATSKTHSSVDGSHRLLEMVALSAGRSSFHSVKVSPFFMSKHPITQLQWSAVASLPKAKRDLSPTPAHFRGSNLPIESVSWVDAVEFCDRLTQHTGRQYQLPTEAQWEYACRAGTHTPFHTGETITSELADYVSTYTYKSETAGRYRQSTLPVGQFSPNAFGLQDMHGNVWEWCADSWHGNNRRTQGQSIASQPTQMRAIRGGSWLDAPHKLRSTSRSGYAETGLNRTIGFRVVAA